MPANDDTFGQRSRGLERSFDILDFLHLRGEPMRPNEIAMGLAAPRSSIYQLVGIMLNRGMLEYIGGDGRVFLGRKLFFYGTSFANKFDLLRECEKVLQDLANETRETAQLCMLDGNKYTVALMKEGSRPFRISSNAGEPVPIPWTASGRFLVAHMTDQEIIDFIPAQDFVMPNGRHAVVADFIRDVREASLAGYLCFDSRVDNFSLCFAVPIFDGKNSCVATICLLTPKQDGLKKREEYVASLQQAANVLSQQLRFQQQSASRSLGAKPYQNIEKVWQM